MPPDPPKSLRLRRSRRALRRQEKIHVRCFQKVCPLLYKTVENPEWLFCFAQNLQTLVTILIYKNFFGPLGYSASADGLLASAYVMVGPERYHHLRFEA